MMNDYISKVISKVYAVVDGKQKAVAEVIEGCGCGFTHLIRIEEKYKSALPIFAKCLQICGNDYAEINITYEQVERSIKNGYVWNNESIAVIIDKVL